jgi:hypothetical protein
MVESNKIKFGFPLGKQKLIFALGICSESMLRSAFKFVDAEAPGGKETTMIQHLCSFVDVPNCESGPKNCESRAKRMEWSIIAAGDA